MAGLYAVWGPVVGARLNVPLHPAGGAVCTVRFDVAHTIVPGRGDPRTLGAHFLSFTYRR